MTCLVPPSQSFCIGCEPVGSLHTASSKARKGVAGRVDWRDMEESGQRWLSRNGVYNRGGLLGPYHVRAQPLKKPVNETRVVAKAWDRLPVATRRCTGATVVAARCRREGDPPSGTWQPYRIAHSIAPFDNIDPHTPIHLNAGERVGTEWSPH